jgi:hypothetical protein
MRSTSSGWEHGELLLGEGHPADADGLGRVGGDVAAVDGVGEYLAHQAKCPPDGRGGQRFAGRRSRLGAQAPEVVAQQFLGALAQPEVAEGLHDVGLERPSVGDVRGAGHLPVGGDPFVDDADEAPPIASRQRRGHDPVERMVLPPAHLSLFAGGEAEGHLAAVHPEADLPAVAAPADAVVLGAVAQRFSSGHVGAFLFCSGLFCSGRRVSWEGRNGRSGRRNGQRRRPVGPGAGHRHLRSSSGVGRLNGLRRSAPARAEAGPCLAARAASTSSTLNSHPRPRRK